MSVSKSARTTESKIERLANGLVVGIARHWLAFFNIAWGLYVGLPLLAPALMYVGATFPAQLIYSLYSLLCHQLPDHSYFLFGNSIVPLKPELVSAGMAASGGLFAERSFIGNAEIGYKVAFCQRDVAIYGSIFLGGLLFALIRNRIGPINLKWYALFLVPIAIDGFTQLLGWRESSWWLRTLTGVIFGAGSVWLAYPFLQSAMDEVVESEMSRMALRQIGPAAG